MPTKTGVIVVGAGIVGVSTALHLHQRGQKVLLLDRGLPGQETSYGNAGIIETSYVLPFEAPPLHHLPAILLGLDPRVLLRYGDWPGWIRWALDFYRQSQPSQRRLHGAQLRPLIAPALDEHRALMKGTGAEAHLSMAGRVKLHRSAESFTAAAMERQVAQELGVPFEVMDPQDFASLEPCLKPVYHKAVRWTSSARLTNPGAVVAAYADRFTREGGSFFRTLVEAMAPLPGGGWQVTTASGVVQAEHVVLCAGPWSADLVQSLGYRLPLGIKRGYHQHFKAVGDARLSHALVDADRGYLICPMEQGYRLVTGIEFARLQSRPNPIQIERVLPSARELFPLGAACDEAWMGARPCFADSLPVIGPASHHAGLWFNFGHGHSGLTIGPSSGRLLAEMLVGASPFCDPAPYRADRFGRL